MYGPVNGNPPPMIQQGMAYVQQGFGMAQNMMAKFQGDVIIKIILAVRRY